MKKAVIDAESIDALSACTYAVCGGVNCPTPRFKRREAVTVAKKREVVSFLKLLAAHFATADPR
jgi:hypothetical protein